MRYFVLFLLLALSCSHNEVPLRDVDFAHSLGITRLGEEFVVDTKYDKKLYTTCLTLWDKQMPSKAPIIAEGVIPKSIHQLWLEVRPLPRRWKVAQETWVAHHPSWKYRLWTLKDLESLPGEVQDAIAQGKDVAAKEEILSAYILDTFGGSVVDITSECLSSLDAVHMRYHLYANLLPPLVRKKKRRRLVASRTFIGASRGHPLIKAWRIAIERGVKNPLEHSIERYGDDPVRVNIVFPPTYAYPVRQKFVSSFEKRARSHWRAFVDSLPWREKPLFSTLQPESFAVSLGYEKK